ncbi:MAG: proline dehydrogenase family protein [Cytophagales bacterium]|nr:proline dehydrogenase family protein [Cytophagales bacterium]
MNKNRPIQTSTSRTEKSNQNSLLKLMLWTAYIPFPNSWVKFLITKCTPIRKLLRKKLFLIFCGGETLKESQENLSHLRKKGWKIMIDYAVEAEADEKAFEKSYHEVRNAIQTAKPDPSIVFTVIKPSSLGSTILMTKYQNKISLSPTEQNKLLAFEKRLNKLCVEAKQANISLMVDAEEYTFQGYVDQVVQGLIKTFNQKTSTVYTTLQCYRKDSISRLHALYKYIQTHSCHLGLKLVRGAYMEEERKKAQQENYPDPIHENRIDCDNAYQEGLLFCLQHIDKISLCVATHNQQTCMQLIQEIDQIGIPHDHPHLCFAQLYGMADPLSDELCEKGFSVHKYVPYGPIEKVLPYLYRRLRENSSMREQIQQEGYSQA